MRFVLINDGGDATTPPVDRIRPVPEVSDVATGLSLTRTEFFVSVIRLNSELTERAASELRDTFARQLVLVPPLVVLDLSGVTVIEEQGVRVLQGIAELARRADIELRLVAADLDMRDVLSAIDGHGRLKTYPTVDRALAG